MANIGLDIKTRIENASTTERIAMVDSLYNKWIIKSANGIKQANIFECLKVVVKNFNLDLATFQLGTFEKAIYLAMIEVSYLRLYTLQLDSDIKEPTKTIIGKKINAVAQTMVGADNAIRYNFKLQNSIIEDDIGSDKTSRELFDFTPIDTSNTTAYQNFLLYLLENLARKGYRRYNGSCYEKIYTPAGHDTHCWREAMTVEDFIYNSVNKDTHFEMWQNLTNGKGNVKAAEEYLIHHVGVEFEDIKKDRHIFSFNDGIYMTKKISDGFYVDEWFPYGSKKINLDLVSCNYFNMNFDESTRERKEYDYRYNDWWNIIVDKCPLFKSIMDYQEWGEEVQKWLCALIGRCMYDVNEIDGWQVVGFLLGQAGTGKSTIINYVLKRIYETCDVAVMGNNIERKFGLEPIFDKLLYIAPEVKGNFGLEQAEFQSIISGESIPVNKKNKVAVSIPWKVPGMFAGNEVPQYTDNSGSISRRILTFMFNKKVKKGDTQLGNKLEREIGYLIQACNRAYLEKVNNHGSEDVWNVVPGYFIDSRDQMAETTNALAGFLRNTDHVKLGPHEFVKENVFIEAFNEYCKEYNIPKQRWNAQYCLGPFQNLDIYSDKNAIVYGAPCTVFRGVSVTNKPKNVDENGNTIIPIGEQEEW